MAPATLAIVKSTTSASVSRKRTATKAGFDTPSTKKRAIATPREKKPAVLAATASKKCDITTSPRGDVEVLAKPKASSEPPVWAQCRQAMCETLPYYHCYQGSAYTRDGFVYGVLLDEDRETGSSSYCDEEVIISRIAGGTVTDSQGKEMMETTNAAGYLTSFTNNLERGIPIIIIFGKHYQHCPTELNYRYNVAAVFHVTNIWATKVGEELVYRIRYEKESLSSKSWWAVAGSPMPLPDRDFSQKALAQSCISCGKSYPQIYTCGWMCMNDQCQEFPKLDSLPPLNPAFLAERSDHTGKPKAPFSITPALPQLDPDRPFDSYHLARGIVCPECNGCCSKISWYGYECGYACDSAGCGYRHDISHTPVSHSYFFGRLHHEAEGHAIPVDQHCFPVTERSSICEGDFRTTTFDLMPGNFVVHAQGNATANAAPRGPNEIFLGLQTAERMPLERRLKDITRNNQREFTNHFAANFGMPYSYSAKAAHLSVAFSNAPDSVIAALGRLIWTGKRVLPNGAFDDKLNELLLVGYMNDNSMGWHDDGEEGLGITVATLSLGGSAMMHFRMKKKYFNPAALANKERNIKKYDPNRNVPVGSKLWEKRIALNEKYGKIPDEEWEEAKRAMFKEFGAIKGAFNKKLLEIELKHGDYLIMHGGEIQKYFEHEVVSKASLRFGLTARYIDPIAHNIPAEEHHKGVFELEEKDIHE